MRNIVKLSGTARLSNYDMDTFIAHKLSSLTECGAKDASGLSGPWLFEFINGTLFRVVLPNKTRQFIFNFLRRAEGAFKEYESARLNLADFIENRRNHPELNKISTYFHSLRNFETFIAQSYQAYEFLHSLVRSDLGAKGQHLEGDISVLMRSFNKKQDKEESETIEKIRKLYLDSRHMHDKGVEAGNLPKKATVGIWISNNGIESKNAKVTFVEIFSFLRYTANLASRISSLKFSG